MTDSTRSASAGVLALAAATLAGAALAQTSAPNGAMTFPNVRFVHAPPAAAAPAPVAAGGLTAFVDPVSRDLVEPFPEDMRALDTLSARQGAALSRRGAAAPMRPTLQPDGSVSLTLDESYLVYSVARVAGDGRLVRACVPGEAEALRLMALGGPLALPVAKEATR